MNRIPSLVASSLLLGAVQAQELHLNMSTLLGATGHFFCAPVTCAPWPLDLPRGGNLGITTMGGTGQPHLLVISLPPAQCSSLPGIAGPLIVQPTVASMPIALNWGRFYVTGAPGQPTCGGWMGFGSVQIPPGAPLGAQVVMQLAAPAWNGTALQWTLSDAVLGTIR